MHLVLNCFTCEVKAFILTCNYKLYLFLLPELLDPLTVIHIIPTLHDTSIKRKGTLLWAVVGGPIQPAKQQGFFHFCFSGEVRRHMTCASWCALPCLFKVQSTCCRLVRGGRFYRRVCTVGVSHVLAGLRLSFLLTWKQRRTTQIEEHNTDDSLETPRWLLHKYR